MDMVKHYIYQNKTKCQNLQSEGMQISLIYFFSTSKERKLNSNIHD